MNLLDWIITVVMGVAAGAAMYLSTFIHWNS